MCNYLVNTSKIRKSIMYTDKQEIISFFKSLQDRICQQLEAADGGGKFQEDAWERPGGGGGRTRILQGKRIAKGGVNFSAVHGEMPERITRALGVEPGHFLATGVSIVQHPVSPLVPIIHMNVRYFEMDNGLYWFGGGIDLTPHYIDKPDARYFHEQLKAVCDRHHPEFYPRFKKWADDYFYLKHRKETRGVGGIFFDRLNEENEGLSKEAIFAYVKEVGELFAPTYSELIARNQDKPYGERELSWQALRRGRYVEFNLVWDKGTKFGLDTDGRTESILMSLPPVAHWEYSHQPEPGSPEQQTLDLLKKNIDWLSVTD